MSHCEKCSKKATWVTRGGERQACQSHKAADMVSFDQWYCVFSGCFNRPRWAYPDMDRPHYCDEHKVSDMVDVAHKRCWVRKCKRKPGFAYPGQSGFRCFCQDHRDDDMEAVVEEGGGGATSDDGSTPTGQDSVTDPSGEREGRASKRPRKEEASTTSETTNGSSSRGGGSRKKSSGSSTGPPLGRRSTRVAGSKDEVLSLEQAQADNGQMWSVKEVAWVQHG